MILILLILFKQVYFRRLVQILINTLLKSLWLVCQWLLYSKALVKLLDLNNYQGKESKIIIYLSRVTTKKEY